MIYSTSFPLTENPISEGGNWQGASIAGSLGGNAAYTNIQTTGGSPGFAWATQDPATQNDSTSLVNGTWTTNQTVTATANIVTAGPNRELELILNGTIVSSSPGPGILTWYEFTFEIDGLITIFKIDVANNIFTNLTSGGSQNIPGGAILTGDQMRAINLNGALTAQINRLSGGGWTTIATASDSSFTAGHPGIGAFVSAALTQANDGDMGFSAFTALDDNLTPILVDPTSHRMVGRHHV